MGRGAHAAQGAPASPGVEPRRPLVEELRNRVAPEDPAALAHGGQKGTRALRRGTAVELSTAENSFAAQATSAHQSVFRMVPAAQAHGFHTAAAPTMGGMASLDADTAMEADVPRTVWTAAAAAKDISSSAGTSADDLARLPPAANAHAAASPRPFREGELQLARFHSHGSSVSSPSGRPPRSPSASLRPSAAYGSAAAPGACLSLPHTDSQPLGLGNVALARPPSCDAVPMSPSPGPYATIARCQSQPTRTASDQERVEEGSRARRAMWRHGSLSPAAAPASPSTTAAQFYRKSSGLRSGGSSDSGTPVSPPAMPPMQSSAAALLVSEAMAAAAAAPRAGYDNVATQQRLLECAESIHAQASLQATGTAVYPGTRVRLADTYFPC